MARRLTTVLMEFSRHLREARRLAADAYNWSYPAATGSRPRISIGRRDSITELAFLRAFSAWEAFLEEVFILYLLGQQAPCGRKVHRYGFPPGETAAYEWVTEGREYARWTPAEVRRRADRLFRNGRPFTPVLSGHQNLLSQANTVRNAIAHDSLNARQKFEAVVRNELQALPPNTTIGGFLLTTKPRSNPPISFLEFYLDQIQIAARKLVPM
jgi:hypothetical protein